MNRVSVTVFDTYGNGGAMFIRTMPFDKLTSLMSAAEVEAKRVAGLLIEAEDGICFFFAPPPPEPSPIQPTAEEAEPDSDPERSLRALWTAEGVSVERQDELIASVTAKAQPGAMVGAFRIGERIEAMRGTLKAGVTVVTASSSSLPRRSSPLVWPSLRTSNPASRLWSPRFQPA